MDSKKTVSIVNSIGGEKVPRRTSKRNVKATEKAKENQATKQAKKLRTSATNHTTISSDVVVITPKRNQLNKP